MADVPLFAASPADPAVLQAVRAQIARRGVDGHRGRSVVDPAGHLVGVPGLQPLARLLPVRDRPDLVACLADGSLAAVVASSNPDLDDSLDRALSQRSVAHYVALALGAAPSPGLRRRAEDGGVGVLVSGDRDPAAPAVRAEAPSAHVLRRALQSVDAAAAAHQLHYNVPTNVLAWLLCVDPEGETAAEEARARMEGYPVTGSAGVTGAVALGLIRRRKRALSLTPSGRTVRAVLPSLRSWSKVHKAVKGSGLRLVDVSPTVAAAVRGAIADVPSVAFVVALLHDLGGTASLRDLVAKGVRRDPVFGPALFLRSEGTAALTRPDGSVAAHEADGSHVADRPTYQFKSSLQHLGVLAPGPIRSRTNGVLDLDRTVWTLDRGITVGPGKGRP